MAAFFMLLAVLSVFLLVFIRDERIFEQEKEARRLRFERALEAIRNAETLEEKIFRSDPENDGKPFQRGGTKHDSKNG